MHFGRNVSVTVPVSDSQGQPITWVSVWLRGTSNRVATDFEGNFTSIRLSQTFLLFPYWFFSKKEVAIAYTEKPINVTLEEDVSQLDEVCCSRGYGTQIQRRNYKVPFTRVS